MSPGHRHDKDCCLASSSDRVEAARLRMREKALRITSPRLTMLRILAAAKQPLSAEQIHEAAGDDKLDLVTVYRSLVAMDGAGVVQRHPLERGRNLYALVTPGHHHHHVMCRRCGRIERLPGCDSTRLEATAKAKGFVELTHVMEFYGICPGCIASSRA